MYIQANRADKADLEKAEIEVLKKYLPVQVNPDEITDYLKTTFPTEERNSTKKGEMIKSAMTHFAGKTDGRTVSALVDELLK